MKECLIARVDPYTRRSMASCRSSAPSTIAMAHFSKEYLCGERRNLPFLPAVFAAPLNFVDSIAGPTAAQQLADAHRRATAV